MSDIEDSIIINKKSEVFYVEVPNDQYGRYMKESKLLNYNDAVLFESKIRQKYRGTKIVCEVMDYTSLTGKGGNV